MPLVVTNDAGEEVETQFLNPHSAAATLKLVEEAKQSVMSGLGNLGYVSSIDNLTPEQVQSLLAALVEIREKTLEIRGQIDNNDFFSIDELGNETVICEEGEGKNDWVRVERPHAPIMAFDE